MRRKTSDLLIVLLVGIMLAVVGCSSGRGSDAQSEEPTDVLMGTILEIQENSFTVTDQDGIDYEFTYEGDMPEGLDEVEEGDSVLVTFTGDLSETDGFDGTVVEVEKQ